MTDTEEMKTLEAYKLELNKQLEEYKFAFATKLEQQKLYIERFMGIWRALFEYAQISIRTVILVNGAAVTAVLTLLGIAQKNGEPVNAALREGLGIACGFFALGIFAGAMATFLAYLSQFQLMRVILVKQLTEIPVGIRWERTAAIISMFTGLVSFFAGLLRCLALSVRRRNPLSGCNN